MRPVGRNAEPRAADPDARPRSAATLVRHNLVALGAAAVVTVYAAGYTRTREAAERFAAADRSARHPVPPATPAAASPTPLAGSIAQAEPAGESTRTDADRAVTAPVPVSPTPPPPAAQPKPEMSPAPVEPVTTPVSQTDSTLAQAPDSATVIRDSVSAPPVADSVPKPPALRDGEYYGWGTSRHGDIQAGVEIRNGRITAAWVQQCLTRYSCSWIARLPGQVVERQSPEVDYVSGATQSTNAFYYAVVEALARAK